MFSSKSFTVSRLTFRSLIHFEIIFCVYGVRECSHFQAREKILDIMNYWRSANQKYNEVFPHTG